MWTDLLHYENKNWYDVTCQLITECLVALNQNSNKDFELNDYLGEKKKKRSTNVESGKLMFGVSVSSVSNQGVLSSFSFTPLFMCCILPKKHLHDKPHYQSW